MAINSIAIKQIIGAWAFTADDQIAWMCSQVENLQITQNGDSVSKSDANGSTIFTIDRNKSCQITFDSSVLDLSLIAALNGTERVDASNDKKIKVPYIERKVLTATDITNKYVSLAKTPIANNGTYAISFHTLTTDKSLDTNYEAVSGAATSSKFYYDSAQKRVYFPTSLTAGTSIEIIYEYEVTAGVMVTNSADKFPDAAKVRFLAIATDLCSQNATAKALWITAKNAKPATGNTIGFNLDDTISVTLELAYDYCSSDKSFYEIAVAEEGIDFQW